MNARMVSEDGSIDQELQPPDRLSSRHGETPATVVDFIARAHGELVLAEEYVRRRAPEAAWLRVGQARATLLGLLADHAVPPKNSEPKEAAE